MRPRKQERLLFNYIGTEHILLGLLREENSVAAEILHEKGLKLTRVREGIVGSDFRKGISLENEGFTYPDRIQPGSH